MILRSSKILLAALAFCISANAQNTMNATNQLSPQQQCLATLAAYEAVGNVAALPGAINTAFDNGLTINQIKEVFTHLYAYTGFPRSLNALGALQQVIADREKVGIVTEMGAEASPLPADYDALTQGTAVQTQLCGRAFRYDFCPAEDYYLKAHLFGDIFACDVLTAEQRELVTVSALSAMQGTEPQLNSHKQIAQRAGLSAETVEAAAKLAHILGEKSRLRFPIGNENSAYAQYFVGQSYLAPIADGVSNVTFEPGCRNNWHIHHDARQILICVSGEGWYQEWGKPAQKLHPGDVVDIPVGVKHWHGAASDSWFQHLVTHIATAPLAGDTKTGNEWLEPVTDEEYNNLMTY
jgi:4-carboxymuconolactone decarboxylase